MIGQCCNFHGINSTVEIAWDIFRILAESHNLLWMYLQTKLKITTSSTTNWNCLGRLFMCIIYFSNSILCLFIIPFYFCPKFIWSYMELLFSRTKECFHHSLICQLITAYVILSIMWQYNTHDKLNLPPSILQLMPWNF